jgi:hypothetical protein
MRLRHWFILCAVLHVTGGLQAQFIQNLRTDPIAPLAGDPVSVLVDVAFQSASCDEKTISLVQTGPGRFEATALHCLGIMTVICYDTDTLDLGALAAGNYRLVYQVSSGFGPMPCTPGIVPGAMDSIDFYVGPTTGSVDIKDDQGVKVFPNPTNGLVRIAGGALDVPLNWSLTALGSSAIFVEGELTGSGEISLDAFPSGVYLLVCRDALGTISRVKIVKQ